MISKRPPSSRDLTDDVQRLEQLLTVNQLAEHWQLSPRTIHRMIDQEVLPVLRFGRAVRIHPKVVAELDLQPCHRNLQDAVTANNKARSAAKPVPPTVQSKKTRNAK